MMDKWADYLVSAVKTSPDQKHIDFVECHSDFGCVVCENIVLSRTDLIVNMKKGCTYATVFRTAIGKWRKGQEVHLVNVNGEDFLRTDSKNNFASDNFDDVPEC
jgi:hypothetical protein